MARSSNPTNTPTFIVTNSNLKLKRDIVAIAYNLGKSSYSQLVREAIVKLRDSYPEHMRVMNKD